MTVVFAPTARDAERFRFTLATDITPVASVTELEDTLAANAEENLVVVSPDIDWRVVLDVAERYRVARPDVGFIVLRRRMDVASLTQAIRAGVREVVDTDANHVLAFAQRPAVAGVIAHIRRGVEAVDKLAGGQFGRRRFERRFGHGDRAAGNQPVDQSEDQKKCENK